MGSRRRAPWLGPAAEGVADPPVNLGVNESRMRSFRRPGWLQSPNHGTGAFPDFNHSTAQSCPAVEPRAAVDSVYCAYSDSDIATIEAMRVAEKHSRCTLWS